MLRKPEITCIVSRQFHPFGEPDDLPLIDVMFDDWDSDTRIVLQQNKIAFGRRLANLLDRDTCHLEAQQHWGVKRAAIHSSLNGRIVGLEEY
ncbi:MAG TPA: hypothetical protein VGM17_10695 [Rhizomicrobium sp.]|jgi:hypothetical protein